MRGLLVLLFCATVWADSLAPSGHLTSDDRARMAALFNQHLTAPKDLPSVAYAAVGLSVLKLPVDKSVCDYLQKSVRPDETDSLYFAVCAAAAVPGCKIDLTTADVKLLEVRLDSAISAATVYHIVYSLNTLGHGVNPQLVIQALTEALNSDDSALSLGYVFHTASLLSSGFQPYLERIEDAIQQADEVDSKHLQYDGGVGITSIVLTGMYRLSEKAAAPAPLSDERAVKFASYLISRRSIQSLKAVHHLLLALDTLTNNPYHVPVSVSLVSPPVLSVSDTTTAGGGGAKSARQQQLLIGVTDLLGQQLPSSVSPVQLVADSVTRLSDEAVLVSRQQLTPSQQQQQQYALTLPDQLTAGFYQLQLSVQPSPVKKPSATAGKQQQLQRPVTACRSVVSVKVTAPVQLTEVRVAVQPLDGATGTVELPTVPPLAPAERLSGQLQLSDERLVVQLVVATSGGGGDHQRIKCHQVFVRFVGAADTAGHHHQEEEAVFVVQPDAQLKYQLLLSSEELGKRVHYRSGVYQVQLVVGDPRLDRSLLWHVADVAVNFFEPATAATAAAGVNIYQPLPAITHVFRAPEPRPAALVSRVFAALCVLPVLLMLLGWLLAGVSVWQCVGHMTLASCAFVAGIAGIFGLYVLFWLQLNMFVTLKYLLLLGLFTFLCGHKALSHLAKTQFAAKQKTK